MLGHCAKPGAQLRSWLSTKLGAAACGHWPCCIACCCCCCCCLWHELRFCAACLAPKPGKPEPSLRSGELSDDVLGGNLVLYPCSICVEVGELGSIPLVSLVTPACNPWGIPGPFCCILNLHLTRPRSSATMWKSRDPSYLRENPGSAARAKNPTTQTKKKLSTQTRSPSLKFQLLLRKPKETKIWSYVSCPVALTLLWTKLGSSWLLEMKNAQLHTHLLLKNVLWHSKLFQTVPKVKLLSRQTHRKLICTNWLFVFDLFQKKLTFKHVGMQNQIKTYLAFTAFKTWANILKGQRVICFTDSWPVLDVLVKGNSPIAEWRDLLLIFFFVSCSVLFGCVFFCFAFALWFLFVCFALVEYPRTVKGQWIMYRSLFSSSFGALCRYDDVATALIHWICKYVTGFPACLTTWREPYGVGRKKRDLLLIFETLDEQIDAMLWMARVASKSNPADAPSRFSLISSMSLRFRKPFVQSLATDWNPLWREPKAERGRSNVWIIYKGGVST